MKDTEDKGLTPAQKKLPPALQAAIAKKKGKKHMDAEDVEARDIDKDGEIEGWEVGKANAIKKSLSKKNGKDDDSDEDKNETFYSRIPSFLEWVQRKESR